jgi:hypothetical protein
VTTRRYKLEVNKDSDTTVAVKRHEGLEELYGFLAPVSHVDPSTMNWELHTNSRSVQKPLGGACLHVIV